MGFWLLLVFTMVKTDNVIMEQIDVTLCKGKRGELCYHSLKFTPKVYLCRVPHLSKSYLVQKYGGRYFAKGKRIYILFQKYGGRYFEKVRRIYILSRSMEADILKSKKDIYLVQKYGGRYFEKVRRIYIVSRSMEVDMFNKRLVLMVIFCSVHRHNCLFHYHGCSACHLNS